MADRKQSSSSGNSGHRKHTAHGTMDEQISGRSYNRNGNRAMSDENATLDDFHRSHVSSRNSQHSPSDIQNARPAPASSHRKDDTKGTQRSNGYEDYARDPRDDRDEASWRTEARRGREHDESHRSRGSGSSGSSTKGRDGFASGYYNDAGPTGWDDMDWHDPASDNRYHGGRPPSSSRHREYDTADERSTSGATDRRQGRSTRTLTKGERSGSPFEHERHSSRMDRWREFTGSLLAISDDTAGKQPFIKRLLSTRRRIALVSIAAVILLCTIISVPVSAVSAMQSLSLARDGMSHLKSAEGSLKKVQKNPFDTASITSARADFVAAHDDFVQVSGRIGLIPGPVDVVPVAGSKLSGARHLIPIAIDGTQAAIIGCDALNLVVSSLKDPLNPKASGLTTQNYAVLQAKWAQIQQIFGSLVNQINALQPSDLTLDPRLGPAIQSFRTNMPKIEQAVQSVGVLVQLLPQIIGIGQPSNFLVEVLDSTELRPGGGFIGNYGFMTLNGGRLAGVHIQDVDLLDYQVKHGSHVIPVPDQYSWFNSIFGQYQPNWGFRDSNLDADFPTSAQNAEKLYQAEAGDLVAETQYFTRKPVPVVGVIALTPWLIQNALRITGSVHVGDRYNETVTADNLIDKIHYYALKNTYGGGCDYCQNTESGTSDRKRFTGFLFQAFMDKIKTSLSVKMSQFATLFTDSLHSKDIQIYLNDPKAEGVLHQYGLGSAIEAPPLGDSVFRVDANIGGNKSNYVLKYDMSDSVTIDTSGTATHNLTFKYTWPSDLKTKEQTFPADPALWGQYHSYTRVYVPSSAVIQSSSGNWVNTSTSKAFGREVYAGNVYGYFATTQTYTLTWKVPGAATHDATGWHYNLLFQKQAGITWPLTLHIALPSCATLGTHTDLLKVNGAHSLLFNAQQVSDLNLRVDYSC